MKIKVLSKIADRIFAKHGWKKVKESEILIVYEQYYPRYNYTARVEIAHKKHHPNMVHCYDTTNVEPPDYFSPSVGMEGVIMWATLIKMIGVGFLPDTNKTPFNSGRC